MNIATSMNKANQLERDKRHADAAKIYGDILAKFPKNTRARDALDTLQNRVQTDLNPPLDQQNLLLADCDAGLQTSVAAKCAALLNTYRKSHFLWGVLGNCHLHAKNLDEAATCLNKACELNPRDPASFCSLGEVYRAQGHTENALALYKKALSLDPAHLDSLTNMASTLLDLGRLAEAIPLFSEAARQAPDNADILFNYSNALLKSGQKLQAKALLEQTIELAPQLVEAQYNLAQLQTMAGDTEQAIVGFEAVLEKNPGNDSARAAKLHAQAKLNDWSWIEEYQNNRRQLGLTGKPCAPFYALTFEDNPDLLRLRTQAYATALLPMVQPVVQPAAPLAADPETTARPHRLRIGYFSSDYHDHATMRLMAGLLEAHDKSRFDIIAYSYDTAPADAMRSRVSRAVSSFRDISQMSDADVMKMVQQDGLDIAVDLKGFSGDSRTALFSHRLAPLQMSYLGFPGTLGTTALDYFICDHVSCPPGSERFFEEYLIRMPHSHQANDNKRSVSGRQFTRKDCGLPNEGFVFCSFNSSYKITPAEFDIWMRLLDQVEGSVLWLLDCGESAKTNLRREAEQRGQNPNRLIFAPRVPQADHLARHPVADLFLDTFVVNGHATASDALWAGLPVLTLPGQQFAARVGASLVSAIGLPEMIATSAADYEARALELAHDADALAALRSKLQRNRLATSLFDTLAFTRMLERAFDMAHSRLQTGLPPAHLEVAHLEATGSLEPDTPAPEAHVSPAAFRQQPAPPGQIAPQAG